jgi:hypothetical protein
MAKYEVTHRCDHSEVVTLFGPTKDRERKLEWLRSLPCPECCSIDRITSAAAIHELQEAAGLPRLQGSEKQVAWAVQVRQDFLIGWKKIERRLTEAAMTEDATAKLAEELLFEGDAFTSGPLTHEDAKYWIDSRESLNESAINSHLYKIRHEIADQAKAIVADNLPISDADKRDVIRMALDARKQALEDRRQAATQAREESAKSANRTLSEAQEKQAKIWAQKDALALAIRDAIGAERCPAQLTVWNNEKGTEKRVYLDSGNRKACLYVTGSKYQRPGSLDTGRLGCSEQALRVALEMAAAQWKNVRIGITPDGKAEGSR